MTERRAAAKAAQAARREKQRAKRTQKAARYDAFFSPSLLAIAGMLISIAFLFQKETLFKIFIFIFYYFLAKASGKKTSIITTLIVAAGIILANLLVPVGRVLAKWGPLTVTEDALLGGIDKAFTFEGLIYISKASIRQGLKLPGRFGSIVASAFSYYDQIIEYRGKVHAATFFDDVDELMLRVWDSREPQPQPQLPAAAAPDSDAPAQPAAMTPVPCAASLQPQPEAAAPVQTAYSVWSCVCAALLVAGAYFLLVLPSILSQLASRG